MKPKIVAAFIDSDGYVRMLDAFGDSRCAFRDGTDARLAESGQRATWPEGHGVAVIEDIPKPAPLPTAYYLRHGRSGLTTWDKSAESHGWTLVATITFDEAGNPHREDHQ